MLPRSVGAMGLPKIPREMGLEDEARAGGTAEEVVCSSSSRHIRSNA